MRYLLFLLSLIVLTNQAVGQVADNSYTLVFRQPLQSRYALDRYLQRMDDSSCTLKFEDVIGNAEINRHFAHKEIKTDNKAGYCGWLRVSLQNNTSETIFYMLGIPGYDLSRLYETDQAPAEQQMHDGTMPFHAKFIEGRSNIFPLKLHAGERRTFYLRVKADALWWQTWFRLTLEKEDVYRFSWYFYGFYLGILLLLIGISLSLAITYRDLHYLVLSLPLLGMFLWFGDVNGDLHLLLNTPQALKKYAYPYFTSSFLPISVLLFAAYYTSMKKRMRWAFNTLQAFVLIIIGVTLVEIMSNRMTPYLNAALLLMFVFLFATIGSLAAKGDKEAKTYFIFGMPFFLTGIYWMISNAYEIRSPIANIMPMQIGSLFSSLIIGYELYNRVSRTVHERIATLHENKRLIEGHNMFLEEKVTARTLELKAEKEKSEIILLNILPAEVAAELKEKGSAEAKLFEHVTVLFTDFVNFTRAGENMSPQELVDELHECFKAFDEIVCGHGMEKIKTIGDAYLAVAGLPLPDPHHACKAVDVAFDIQDFMRKRRIQKGAETFEVRIGIHSGSVVAGIVGVRKFAYDIWGDTVNTAARMEQNSEPGKINISQATYDLIKDDFRCSFRGEITAKNKGALKMYFVEEKTAPVLL